ncbi:unnamed protein product [Urochloa decumbens]|uniref:MATH domain-containing protein n=1 Tax=Urochloa decumbens TaxID=240449 RepID=A0ABC9FP22_9POAL
MSPSSYAPLRAGAAADIDDTSTSSPETLTVSTVAAAAVGAVGHHLLKIEGYSRLKRTHGGTGSSYIKSGEFTAGGHAWRILSATSTGSARTKPATSRCTSFRPSPLPALSTPSSSWSYSTTTARRRRGRFAAACTLSPSRPAGSGATRSSSPLRTWNAGSSGTDDCFAVRCTVTVIEERVSVEEDVTAEDMDRVGVVCPCKDGSCQFKHERPAETLWEKIALICRFICGEASS